MQHPDQLRSIPDPAERIRAVQEAIAQLSGQQAELVAITRDTVREMNKTLSFKEIGDILGVSTARAHQLSGYKTPDKR